MKDWAEAHVDEVNAPAALRRGTKLRVAVSCFPNHFPTHEYDEIEYDGPVKVAVFVITLCRHGFQQIAVVADKLIIMRRPVRHDHVRGAAGSVSPPLIRSSPL